MAIGLSRRMAIGGLAAAMAVPAMGQFSFGGATWAGMMPAKPIDFGPGATLAPDLLKRIGPDDGSRVKRIVVPYFQVQFVTASRKSSSRAWATIRQNFELEGLTQADMQAIADDLYRRFTGDLERQGFTIVPVAEARAASPSLAKLLAAGRPAPYQGKTSDGTVSTIVTTGDLPIFFHAEDPEKNSLGGYVSNRSYWDQPAAAKELGGALVGARLAINFVEQSNNDKRGLFGYRPPTGRLESQVGLSIEPITTHVWIAGPTRQATIIGQPVSPSRFALTTPLILPATAITNVRSVTGKGRTGMAAVMFGGSGDSYAVTVDPNVFRRDVGSGLAIVTDMLAARAADSIGRVPS